ncbi:MAG TPA: GntG family PLP-dependent aldolase [Mycobacteriales bacterium]|nr:GntG family PLP-dependent aldolase [Mycobacteriales bacterium]
MRDFVDLRSDTVTRPSEQMRQAMAAADVGDDVYGEDPCINALEAAMAEAFDVAAAMYVPSGTMGNQIAVRLLCPPGGELLTDADAHLVTYEGGGLALHGGIQTRTVVAERGLLTADDIAPQLRAAGYHAVPTSAVAVEQTHNRGGGAVYPLDQLASIRQATSAAGVRLHCDGARIWNAHVASGVPLPAYAAHFDTLSVCLSKGLGAPVGSVVLMADAAMAEPARELRHQVGGAMRQAGILAAGGLYALRHNVDRLADDHARARRLADGLAGVRSGLVDPQQVETNIVLLALAGTGLDAATVAERCRADGVLVSPVAPTRVRLVTHLDVDDDGIERALAVLRGVLSA